MRTIPRMATLALAAGVHAATWTALPEIPRSSAGTISGDGSAVAYSNFLGGTSMRQPTASNAPWIKLRAEAKTKSVVVRKNMIAYRSDDGVVYGALGDSILKTAYFGGTPGPLSGIDHDGGRILAVASGWNVAPSLFLSVDSLLSDPVLAKGGAVGSMHAWRLLHPPTEFSQSGEVQARIEGRVVVASNAVGTIVSRDTGATWALFPIPNLKSFDLSGDTIVGRSNSSKRLFVSTDAGASWDSSALSGPWSIAFRGGKLYGQLSQSDSTYDLVSSANLGKTWNTILEEVNSSPDNLAWDGQALWATRRDALLRSTNEGRTWTVADSGVGETILRKLRAFGYHLLALQALKDPDSYEAPFHRLWDFDGREWRVVRDSVSDFQVMETDTGRAVFVLVDTGSLWRSGAYAARMRLERSYNLKSWQVMPAVSPNSLVLGMSKRGLLVGQASNVAVFTSGSKVLLDTAWKHQSAASLSGRSFLVEQDGELAWADHGEMYRSVATQAIFVGHPVRGYATAGSKYGFSYADTNSSWLADFTPMSVAYPLLKPSLASGNSLIHDSIAFWNGSDTIALMRPEGERRVLGPENQGVTQVEYMSTSALGSNLAMIDSTFAVADLHGRVWRLDKYGSSGVAAPRSFQSALSCRPGGVSLELARAGRVRIALFDGRGRTIGEIADGWFREGRHWLPVPRVGEVAFAVATIDGNRQISARLPPSLR